MIVTRSEMTTRGFTLIELMIAMLITGIVSVVIYGLFDTTSDNFLEVDQLAEVDDKLRFSMDRLRTDLQMAGAQMTPDSTLDPWVQPTPTAGVRFAGIMPYPGWQDDQSVMTTDIAGANPNVSYDGLVVMGAFDYPLSFEVRGLVPNPGGTSDATIDAHYRGLMRLRSANPFLDGLSSEDVIDDYAQVSFLERNWTTRLIRVLDRQGFMQFIQPSAPLDSDKFNTPVDDEDWYSLTVEVPQGNDPLGPKYKQPSAAGLAYGLDDVPEEDVGYDAGLIDAYWYHVIQDPQDSHNYQLVRERLCAAAVVENFGNHPSTMLADDGACPGGQQELVVVADHVADFQVWFDCAIGANGDITGSVWQSAWSSGTAGIGPPVGACMAGTQANIGQARVAHVRLSIYTPNERKNQAHIQFENTDGASTAGDTPDTLRTFDSYPKTEGAARVATLQADFELANFVARNLFDQPPPSP